MVKNFLECETVKIVVCDEMITVDSDDYAESFTLKELTLLRCDEKTVTHRKKDVNKLAGACG